MLIFYLTLSLLYVLFIAWVFSGLRLLRRQATTARQLTVNVIIPARNEAANIARCLDHLQRQTYPAHLYEIVVVDDGSEDETSALAKACGVRCLALATIPPGWSPKKAALALGIRDSNADIILTTDADCRAPQAWIESMVSYFTPDVGIVASWVGIANTDTVLSRVEAWDAWSYQLIGAAAIGHGRPFLANGANWGYRRQLFKQINGFDGIESLASGDDDLLLQKMADQTEWRTAFCDDASGRVVTTSCPNWAGFFRQRLRWASKTSRYPLSVIFLEGFIFLYNCSLLYLLFSSLKAPGWLLFLLVKLVGDVLLVRFTMQNKTEHFRWSGFVLAQIGQMIYTVVIGLFAWRGRFVWKNRTYAHGALVSEKRV